jgi:hypothetical protein
MFQDRFADMVRHGSKPHTIRKTARCKPGDVLSLRRWTGKPYRSKQETIREAVCTAVSPVAICEREVMVNAEYVHAGKLAAMDGFRDWVEMRDWFDSVHGLPFHGWLIEWSNAEAQRPAVAGTLTPLVGNSGGGQ